MNLLTEPNIAGLLEYVEDHEVLDPNDSDKLCDHAKGQTIIHAWPARFEDEGQCGG